MKAPTVEILEPLEPSVAKVVFPDRDDSCPICGADGDLEFGMIRTRGSIIGYYAGFVYHCHACGTAWPLCSVGEKKPIDDWVQFDEFYEGLE
ncbi:MAG: hypothetical protein JSW05_06600 [Candidatus Thorarchaeota archaeon]|nr:MAG: hypothetical protein JSW05_06600 [Candidatus Thorarchaeota archaeon]